MAMAGIPDRGLIAEAVLQELLREAWSAGTEKNADIFEHRVLVASMKRLLRLKKLDGTPQFTRSGVKYRFEDALNQLLGLPKPDLDAVLAGALKTP